MTIFKYITVAVHVKRPNKAPCLYLELAAHFLVGFNEPILVVQHDAVLVLLCGVQTKSHLQPVFLTITSQGYQVRTLTKRSFSPSSDRVYVPKVLTHCWNFHFQYSEN